MRSDEVQDVFEDIVSKAAETHHRTKLDAFLSIFLNALLSKKPSYDEATEIAALVDGLQERHTVLLRILADPMGADSEVGRRVGEGNRSMASIRQILKTLLPSWDPRLGLYSATQLSSVAADSVRCTAKCN